MKVRRDLLLSLRKLSRAKRVFLMLVALIASWCSFAQAPNDPSHLVREPSEISPPLVHQPIHECALTVQVDTYVKHARIRIYSKGKVIGDQPLDKHPPGVVKLFRPLDTSDSITATQTINSIEGGQSYDSVPVTGYPDPLTTPVALPDVYQCGQVVPAANMVESTHVEVSEFPPPPPNPLPDNSPTIGSNENTSNWDAVTTAALAGNQRSVVVRQIACPANATPPKEISPFSAPLGEKQAPNPPPAPTVKQPCQNCTEVLVGNLKVGAEIAVNVGGTVVTGLANADSNIVDIPPAVPGITATQKLCTTSPPSAPVDPKSSLNIPILGNPICPGAHYVSVANTDLGATVMLYHNGSFVGATDGNGGTVKFGIGSPTVLNENDTVEAVQVSGSAKSTPSDVTVGCGSGGNVVTQHNDNFRTGVYPYETTLTPAAVLARGMKLKWQHPIDGWLQGQPLYVRNVEFQGRPANAVFVGALFSNKVYALNADTGNEIWSTALVDSDLGRRNLSFGIDSTPVIDAASNRIYVVFATKNQKLDTATDPDSTHPPPPRQASDGTVTPPVFQDTDLKNLDVAFWLVALDTRTGKEVARTMIRAVTYRTNGQTVSFEGPFHRQHPALLLDHGSVYVAFGSIAGSEAYLEYHGWVMAYSATDLSFQGSFNTSKDYAPPRTPYTRSHPDDAAGIWQGGGGLAADPDGNIYFATGNGTADVVNGKYGDTFVKLFPTGSTLAPVATSVPFDSVLMQQNDSDLGAGGMTIIPGGGPVIGGGKAGFMFALERGTLQQRQEFTASTNQYDPARRDDTWNLGPHLHGSPTYWRGPDRTYGYLYVWGEKDYLRRYSYNTLTGKFETCSGGSSGPGCPLRGSVKALETFHAMPGGMISVSTNGNHPGSAVLWAVLPTGPATNLPPPGRLYAFNAETFQPLWDTAIPSIGHWAPPAVADGKVFVATSSGFAICYELGPEQSPGTTTWVPYKPMASAAALAHHMTAVPRDEVVMNTLSDKALAQISPPPEASKYAVLIADGTISFAPTTVSSGEQSSWRSEDTSLEVSVTVAGQLFPRKEKIHVEITPDLVWTASDGSRARAELVQHFAAPQDGAASWALYRVKSSAGSGILTNITYIQRLATEGGTPPDTSPGPANARARAAFSAKYVLYKEARP
ncbi:DUF3455 domain-containing protein [Paraburkholderia diazotrophica]|uniref:PQQ-like domain-containing protein n=1 Tax=Paraburkholderia diazotrophica TaxID=667676 RepID=A0A1H6TLX8_9BURK|nr:DUF3455 domain-containing protein [Paraburkholderia diazotrophica]SEI80991.1 PQQ-like domain-containing protein [Paraburkholderia diazotrophica]